MNAAAIQVVLCEEQTCIWTIKKRFTDLATDYVLHESDHLSVHELWPHFKSCCIAAFRIIFTAHHIAGNATKEFPKHLSSLIIWIILISITQTLHKVKIIAAAGRNGDGASDHKVKKAGLSLRDRVKSLAFQEMDSGFSGMPVIPVIPDQYQKNG